MRVTTLIWCSRDGNGGPPMTEFTVSSHGRLAAPAGAGRSASEDIAVPSHSLAHRSRGWTLWLILAGLLIWSWSPAEMYRVVALFTDWRNMAEFGRAFLRPDFHEWRDYLADMIVTVQIALW